MRILNLHLSCPSVQSGGSLVAALHRAFRLQVPAFSTVSLKRTDYGRKVRSLLGSWGRGVSTLPDAEFLLLNAESSDTYVTSGGRRFSFSIAAFVIPDCASRRGAEPSNVYDVNSNRNSSRSARAAEENNSSGFGLLF